LRLQHKNCLYWGWMLSLPEDQGHCCIHTFPSGLDLHSILSSFLGRACCIQPPHRVQYHLHFQGCCHTLQRNWYQAMFGILTLNLQHSCPNSNPAREYPASWQVDRHMSTVNACIPPGVYGDSCRIRPVVPSLNIVRSRSKIENINLHVASCKCPQAWPRIYLRSA
jgi:hypothetical protein